MFPSLANELFSPPSPNNRRFPGILPSVHTPLPTYYDYRGWSDRCPSRSKLHTSYHALSSQHRIVESVLQVHPCDSAVLHLIQVTFIGKTVDHIDPIFVYGVIHRSLSIDVLLIDSQSFSGQIIHAPRLSFFANIEHDRLLMLVFEMQVRTMLDQRFHNLKTCFFIAQHRSKVQ